MSSVAVEVKLHVFYDASESGAYGACGYLRQKSHDGDIMTALVMGKFRVAPLKSQTIPRMELTAAVVVARLSSQVQRELDVALHSTTLWTDSMVVLGYIRNQSRRFKLFVANRVTAILEETEADEWNYVKGKLNPADLASRGIAARDQDSLAVWLKGLPFSDSRRIVGLSNGEPN